jgi:hypothetical protein
MSKFWKILWILGNLFIAYRIYPVLNGTIAIRSDAPVEYLQNYLIAYMILAIIWNTPFVIVNEYIKRKNKRKN